MNKHNITWSSRVYDEITNSSVIVHMRYRKLVYILSKERELQQ